MAAAEQLCLLEFSDEQPDETSEPDIVETPLDNHHGNYREAMRELLEDADFLRDQLYTASCLMSKGMGRGWKPKYERLRPCHAARPIHRPIACRSHSIRTS